MRRAHFLLPLLWAGLTLAFPPVALASPAEPSAPALAAPESEAQELRDRGQYVQAAEKYVELATTLPKSSKAQQSWLKAGSCWFKAGCLEQAIKAYDAVIALGSEWLAPDYLNPDGTDRELPHFGRGQISSIRERVQMALRDKVLVCREMGNAVGEAKGMLRLMAEFPTSEYIVRLLPPQLGSREQAGAELARRGHDLFLANKHDEAFPFLDQVIIEYSETAASLRARADKAAILWARSDWDLARALYADIWQRVGKDAPNSTLGRVAECRIAWLQMGRLMKDLRPRKAYRLNVPTGPEWEEVRQCCKVIMSKNPDLHERAAANVTLIESFSWQGDFENVLGSVKVYLRNYASKSKKDSELKRLESHVRGYAADAYFNLKRYDEALV